MMMMMMSPFSLTVVHSCLFFSLFWEKIIEFHAGHYIDLYEFGISISSICSIYIIPSWERKTKKHVTEVVALELKACLD